jgi:hypothetical protein
VEKILFQYGLQQPKIYYICVSTLLIQNVLSVEGHLFIDSKVWHEKRWIEMQHFLDPNMTFKVPDICPI